MKLHIFKGHVHWWWVVEDDDQVFVDLDLAPSWSEALAVGLAALEAALVR